ncbi:MAG: ATP-binding protein [Eubacteriaceae bacterium]
MRKFIGRRAELKLLNNVYDVEDAFVLVSGVRYVGKSALVKMFSNGKPALYFGARELADELNRRYFNDQVADYYNEPVNPDAEVPDWTEIFRAYAERPEADRKVLVLDNLELLIQANGNFPRLLRTAWDKSLKPAGVMVIAIIRSGSVLINLEGTHNPLLGALSMHLRIPPVSFIEMLRDYPHKTYRDLVSLYAITGGIPLYWRFFKDTPTLLDQLGVTRVEMLNKTGWFYNEPIDMITAEVYEPIEYISVMQTIALGKFTMPEIADFLKYRPKQVQNCLTNLQSLGLIRSEMPVTEKRFNLKKARWFFEQPTSDFWFTFVYPRRPMLDSGNTLPAYEFIRQNFNAYAEYWFSKVSTEMFLTGLKQKSFDFVCDKVGSFWDRDGNMVDIAALDHSQKKIFLGECIYSDEKPSLADFEDFIRDCGTLKDLGKYRDYTRVYGLFTITHPERELIDYAMNNDNVVVFEGTTLYRKTDEKPVPVPEPDEETEEKTED